MGSDSISCPKPFLGEIINFRAEQPNRKFSICVMTASSARKLGIIWNPLPDSGSGLVLGLSNSKRTVCGFLTRISGTEKGLLFANSQDPNFASRASSALDISRLVTDLVTVNDYIGPHWNYLCSKT